MADTDTDFQKYFEQTRKLKTSFKPGEKVSGRISAITPKTVFVDIGAKSEGLLDRAELEADGEMQYQEGDTIEAFFTHSDGGELHLAVKIKARGATDEALMDAHAGGIPVEGRVESERAGGFDVKVGNASAFCPFSQMDMYGGQDNSQYIGQRFSFLITECNDRNLVVSRRRLLELEKQQGREKLLDELREGTVVDGVVRRIMDFGVFVDIGGVEGLVPMGELAWNRVEDAAEIVKPGDKVQVYVNTIDWAKDRFSLSLRRAAGDPWDEVVGKYHETKQYSGVVTRLMDFGAFVQLEPGIEGLVHISKLGAGKRLNHARQVLEEGQDLEVYVESVDLDRRRIGLALENPQQGRTMEVGDESLTIGESRVGKVEDIKQFGLFVSLSPRQTGLVHVSRIPLQGQANKIKEMWNKYPPGSELTVIVEQVRGGRISLALPETPNEDDEDYREFLEAQEDVEEESNGFGSMGGAFDSLNL
jgi:small subunit ribosomal protein S1